jgi:RHS repeat-associated protein
MKRLFIFFFLIPLFLRADWDHLFSEDEDPTLFHHVNVITGNLNLCMQDGVVQGVTPLPLMRTYTSSGALERSFNNLDVFLKYLRKGWLIQGGWNFFPHTNLLVEFSHNRKEAKAYLAEKSGNLVTYFYSHKASEHTLAFKPQQSSHTLSARSNVGNNRLHITQKTGEAVLFLPDGGERIYVGDKRESKCYYRLLLEILPSKHLIHYFYDKGERLKHIEITNPSSSKTYSWVHFKFLKVSTPFQFRMRTSDKKAFTYTAMEFKGRDYIEKIESNCRPFEEVHYSPGRMGTGARMAALDLGGIQQFKAKYVVPPNEKIDKKWFNKPDKKPFAADRVEVLEAPVAANGDMLPIAKFHYGPGYTEVRDVDNILTRYRFDSERLRCIEYFDHQDNLHSTTRFLWKDGRLHCKTKQDEKGKSLFAKTFHYDSSGNVLEEVFWGNLTGSTPDPFSLNAEGLPTHTESYRKTYTYLPRFNVPLSEEEEEGLTYRYSYKPDTDLLTAKFTCDHNKILIREFFFYDQDNLLICEMTDDGTSQEVSDLSNVTERHIKRYTLDPDLGLPKRISEFYLDGGKEVFLRKVELDYGPDRRVSSEAIYDATEVYRYTLYTDYDAHGHVTRKTTPVSGENTYTYNSHDHLEEAKEVGSPKKTYTYDRAGRLLTCTELGKTTISTYDPKGRVRSQTDAKGNTTFQSYDSFGRCLKTEFPTAKDEEGKAYTPTITFTYDIQGNLASSTTPKGETTQTLYNVLRKPTRIQQADGTVLTHTYHKCGTLATTTQSDGTQVHYTYDLFQRPTSKTTTSAEDNLLSTETWRYNAFHLLSYTDPQGLTTTYTYDKAGRKTAEQAEHRKRTYTYDALGFLERTTDGEVSHVQIHDEAGRVCKQWTEDTSGRTENLMRFTYDEEGRKKTAVRLTAQGDATDLFEYDPEGRLYIHTDPKGALTKFLYEDTTNDLDQRVLKKSTIDPLGNTSIEIYDATNRLISCEKQTPQAETASLEELFYDRSGNKAKRVSTVYLSGTPLRTTAITWEHDAMGRVIQETEAGAKTTRYIYDPCGRIQKRILPSSTILRYTYDGLGRLILLQSSDDTIYDQYFYSSGPQPIEIVDHVNLTKLERTYNLFGELTQENQLSWDYDNQGRCILFTLPDRSYITYSYTGAHLTGVHRYAPTGTLRYEHLYTNFDPNGHVSQEELIHNLGTVHTTHDLLERPSSQTSSWLTHSLSYGPSNLVIEKKNSLFGNKTYDYDALNQLTQEGEQTHLFDSLGNPAHHTTNDLNQIETILTYDPNGNPTHRTAPDTTYTYDALGRLTSLTTPHRKVHYCYDPLSRLHSKETFTLQYGTWVQEDLLFYLYDQDKEIGTLDKHNNILQLKVLGLGTLGDIGAAIALELDNTTYAPLHDFSGNLIALLSPTGLTETYDIDAFGNESHPSSLNPWRFCSKRSDENLIFFGKRFYDPSLGRWLTPDPAGFADSPNLYLYVLNNPLNRLDLFGLKSQSKLPGEHRIELQLPIRMLVSLPHINVFVRCKAIRGEAEENYFVSCGHWHKLQFTNEEIATDKINIVEHLNELVPSKGRTIGLITVLNGVDTDLLECRGMNRFIGNLVPEGTLILSRHNPSEGSLKADIKRTHRERAGEETPTVSFQRQFMADISERLYKINPKLIWLMVPHSEGGVITRRAIEGMTSQQQAILRQQMRIFAVAPAEPIPNSYAFSVRNIYSEEDGVTGSYGREHQYDSNYSIQFIHSTSTWSEKSRGFLDHRFLGKTYRDAIDREFNYVRGLYGFHGSTTR